jgi:hypothetical protein
VDSVDRAGGALHQVERQIEVVLHLIARRQASRYGGECLQERGDRPAVRGLRQGLNGPRDRRQRVFADASDDRRPFFEKGQHRFDAATQAPEQTAGIQIGADPLGRKDGQCVPQTGLEDFADLRKAAVELRAVRRQTLGPGAVEGLAGRHHGPETIQAKTASIA